MNTKVVARITDSIKFRFSGGLLCCLVLLAAYLFQIIFPDFFLDPLGSSTYLMTWLTLFVGAFLWTIRERGTHGLSWQIIDWQCVAAFLLCTCDQIYTVIPKSIQLEINPVISEYMLPVLVVGGIIIGMVIKFSISLHHKLEHERQQSILQMQQLKKLLDSPPSSQKGMPLVRKLIENQSIAQFTCEDYALLLEGCQIIDPDLFAWIKAREIQPTARDIVYCVLVRMRKSKEEIISIFRISDASYRTMKTRIRKRLNVGENDLDTFIQELP